jgi:hypothetical protein
MDSREIINGVERFKPSCSVKSLYDHRLAYTHITIERKTLEREIFRVIEEAKANGGEINELALRCMTALDADASVEMREKADRVKFTFETDIVRQMWQRGS